MLFHFVFVFLLSFYSLGAAVKEDGLGQAIENALLPQNHPLQERLQGLFPEPTMFDSPEALTQLGFKMKWNVPAVNADTILVASHPAVKNYLIKKHLANTSKKEAISRYLARIHGAEKIAQYIKERGCKHLIVPKKWLYRLPSSFNDPASSVSDYLLIVEKIDICDGGWWGGETLDKYQAMNAEVLRELCFALHDLKGCDAWPQNQPFTCAGKIAFIDTEHLGRCYGDFLERTMRFINPKTVNYALQLWNERQYESPEKNLDPE